MISNDLEKKRACLCRNPESVTQKIFKDFFSRDFSRIQMFFGGFCDLFFFNLLLLDQNSKIKKFSSHFIFFSGWPGWFFLQRVGKSKITLICEKRRESTSKVILANLWGVGKVRSMVLSSFFYFWNFLREKKLLKKFFKSHKITKKKRIKEKFCLSKSF